MHASSARWRWLGLVCVAVLSCAVAAAPLAAADWQPAKGPLMTRWSRDVKPDKVHPEYPRPQLVRAQWVNLNGLWQYALAPKEKDKPAKFSGEILVPFPVESALSGVMQRVDEKTRLWYRRTFTAPAVQSGQRTLLHFGAVDWQATVWVNGQQVAEHKGGYDPFTCDITAALKPQGEQELVVAVWDPTDKGTQPRGKQVQKPGGIFYTPTTGIWQTVWLEVVPETFIASLKITPDVDNGQIQLVPKLAGSAADSKILARVFEGDREVASAEAKGPDLKLVLKVANPRLWSPDDPFLYRLKVAIVGSGGAASGDTRDEVESYCGMRKIALGKDSQGITRILLNGQPLFQLGTLDQGFWPDGLYTAPTDEALRYDIEMTRRLGFNMARKHVKVEPDRWYYWCDKLGLLVWQDMPSGDKSIGGKDADLQRSPESARQYEQELQAMIDALGNHPSIVLWVPFNEGWGQFDTVRIAKWIQQYDPTRLVDCASGWVDRPAGDVHDIHSYPGPASPQPEEHRAAVLGEFGGLGLPMRNHVWQSDKNWGYKNFTDVESLTKSLIERMDLVRPLIGSPGLSAAIYTQTTDVEGEVNGLLTYDRAIVKPDVHPLSEATRRLQEVLPAARAASAAPQGQWRSLFDGKTLRGWQSTPFGGHGDVEVQDGQIVLGFGEPLTGVSFTGEVPRIDYEFELDAQRVDGADFFCGLTFPVGEDPCSFIVGGWGGGVVGISSLDHEDAANNETTRFMEFVKGRWYHIKLRVTKAKIEAWIDKEQVVDVELKGKKISIRHEVELSRPLGIASYMTSAALKNLRVRSIADKESPKSE